MSKKPSDCWITPPEIFEFTGYVWPEGIGFDPFGHPRSLVPAERTRDIRDGVWDAIAGTAAAASGRWLSEIVQCTAETAFANGPYSAGNPQKTAAVVARLHLDVPEVMSLTLEAPGSAYFKKHVWPWASCVVHHGRLAFIAGEDIIDEKTGRVKYKAGTRVKGNRFEACTIYMGQRVTRVREAARAQGWPVTAAL